MLRSPSKASAATSSCWRRYATHSQHADQRSLLTPRLLARRRPIAIRASSRKWCATSSPPSPSICSNTAFSSLRSFHSSVCNSRASCVFPRSWNRGITIVACSVRRCATPTHTSTRLTDRLLARRRAQGRHRPAAVRDDLNYFGLRYVNLATFKLDLKIKLTPTLFFADDCMKTDHVRELRVERALHANLC